ncbi:hypothetical protein R1flu_019851 [Riccia fluitans]|uniref:Uncharacterized protein n=1 Tax=Riccia fluitans TaxID=41844 RepID=A0ABD1ZK27_9MARC
MGCTSSKVDNEEGVGRCRARKKHIKHAVSTRHGFASAHSQYVQALKASGAAFRQFAEGEQGDHREKTASQTPLTPATPLTPLLKIKEALPPPPPPHLSPGRADEINHHRSRYSGTVPDPLLLEEVGRGSPHQEHGAHRPESLPVFTVVSETIHESREEEWEHYNSTVVSAPSQSSNPPPPPPVPRNTWHNLFFDPFRPVPQVEFNNPSSPPFHETENQQAKEATSQGENSKGDDDMPPLEMDRTEEEVGRKEVQEVQVQLGETPKPQAHQEFSVAETNREDTTVVDRGLPNDLSGHESPKGRDLLEVLRDVDDMFLKAAECGDVVSRMLETKKVHYHSSFSDVRGFAENSTKVFNSTFWTRSLSRNSSTSNGLLKEFNLESSNGEVTMGSHASTLDRLFAWEKKLHDEVKSAEAIRIDLEKNCARLRNQDAKGDDPVAIDKTRAAIKVLHTRFMVALQAVDTASNAVHRIRDEELYAQLLELSEGLSKMWKQMNECHHAQQLIAQDMKSLTNSAAAEATTASHRQTTLELATALSKMARSFSSIVTTQKEYLNNLTGWLRLSLVEPDAELRDDQVKPVSSAPKVANTPIYSLCQDWHRALDKLPDKVTLEAINAFVAVVNEWVRLQSEELKHKKKAESLERELIKKEQFLDMLERKYVDSTPVSDEKDEFETDSPRRAALNENKNRVEQFRLKVELEKEEVEKAIQATRAMTLTGCQSGLPAFFSALSHFSAIAHQTYRDVHAHAVNINLPRIAG